MKKLLSILMTLAILLGTLSVITVMPASATTTESLDDHLITHWDFNGTGDDALKDKATSTDAKNSDTLVLYGASTAGDGIATIPNYSSSKYSGTDTTIGNNSTIYANNSEDLFRTTENRTLFIRFKNDHAQFPKTSTSTDEFHLVAQNGAIHLGVNKSTNQFYGSTNVGNISENWMQTDDMYYTANAWTNLAVSYQKNDDKTITIYTYFKQDGGEWITGSVTKTDSNATDQTWVQDDYTTNASNNAKFDKNALMFGRQLASFSAVHWPGTIILDDIRVYNDVLTINEVISICDEFETPVGDLDANLITHWDFQGDDNTYLTDKATNGDYSDTLTTFGHVSKVDDGIYVKDNYDNKTPDDKTDDESANGFHTTVASTDLMRTTADRTIYIRFKSDKTFEENNRIELASQNGALRLGLKAVTDTDTNSIKGEVFGSTNPHGMGENSFATTGMTTYAPNTWITVAVSFDKTQNSNAFIISTYYKIGTNAWVCASIERTDANQTWEGDDTDYTNGNETRDSDNLYFGRLAYNGSNTTWGGNLTYNDIRIYDKALTFDEVTSISNNNVTSEGCSLSLGGDIGVNFYLKPDTADIAANATVTIANGENILLNAAKFSDEIFVAKEGAFKFTAHVAAKEMTDTLTLIVKNGEITCYTATYSVLDYANVILENKNNYESYKTAQPLVQAMLNYGAQAQTYFNYNTENLANAGLEDGDKTLSAYEFSDAYKAVVSNAIDGVSVSATLKLESMTQIAFTVNLGADYAQYTVNGEAATAEVVTVYSDGVYAHLLGNKQKLTITKTGVADAMTVEYAPMTYMMNQKDTASVQALLQALNAYYVAADAYANPSAQS